MITASLALAFGIFVWLRTNAVVEFLGFLLSWGNIFYVYDYASEPDTLRNNLRYPLWLYVKHPNMLTKLISCPLCTSFWANVLLWRSIPEALVGAFLTLLAFSVLDKLYQHG